MSVWGYAIFIFVVVALFWFFGVDGYESWFMFLDDLKERKNEPTKNKRD